MEGIDNIIGRNRNPQSEEVYYLDHLHYQIIAGVFLILIIALSLKPIANQIKYMEYKNIKIPVIFIFLSSLVFQSCNIASLFSNKEYFIITKLIEKIYLGCILLCFYFLIGEIVFFETLFNTGAGHNMPMFISSQDEASEQTSSYLKGIQAPHKSEKRI